MSRADATAMNSGTTFDEAVQGAEPNADRVVERSEPGPLSTIKIAGQIVLGVFLPWMGPKSLD